MLHPTLILTWKTDFWVNFKLLKEQIDNSTYQELHLKAIIMGSENVYGGKAGTLKETGPIDRRTTFFSSSTN
jgi:hypothetical protein